MTAVVITRRLTLASVALLVFGILFLLAYCVMEAIGSGISLVDAYWRGRLPWMGIAEALVVVGATASIVTGTLAALVRGGWWRRLATLPPLAVASMWWILALTPPPGGAFCPACAPPQPDPWAYAYSLPETFAVFMLLPAAVTVFLALWQTAADRRATPRTSTA